MNCRRRTGTSAAEQRDPADHERHHAADEAHRPQDVLAADDRDNADEPEQDRHHDRDPGEAQPLEDRSLLALRVRLDVRQLDRPLRGVVGLGDGFAGAVGLVAESAHPPNSLKYDLKMVQCQMSRLLVWN